MTQLTPEFTKFLVELRVFLLDDCKGNKSLALSRRLDYLQMTGNILTKEQNYVE